ncbi:MAG TPA: LpqB family beta-propeller domain-containing protein [Terriglobales bacterium]|nr:LpqB family beta-propeller domain-containing protein [Terriglobales bacterium]
MNPSAESPTVIRFGVYSADLRAGELRKSGVKVKLQEQPFQILAMLLERPGEVVTREELRKRLWPADTFVDFDHSLNTAVKKLREALGDDADNPRFVETLHRRGYRFIAPVGGLAGNGSAAGAGMAPETAAQVPVTSGRTASEKVSPAIVLALLVALLAAGTVYMLWRPAMQEMPQAAMPAMQVVPFTSAPGAEFTPAFSPDGKHIAYGAADADQQPDLYVQLVGASSQLRLTQTPDAAEASPTWSPDGRYLAFMRYREGESSLMVIPALGGAERTLYRTRERAGVPAWSPDGKYIAFTEKTGAEKPLALFLLSLDTLERRQLTHPDRQHEGDSDARFSPDGRQVAFLRETRETADIYTVAVEGGEPRRITFQNALIIGLDWTPDGRQIIFASFGGATARLWRVPVTGGEPQSLGVGGEGALSPTVAPQGNRLAYVQHEWDADIVRIPVARVGARAQSATPLIVSTRKDEGPQFSPDGKKIAFQSTRSGFYEIWVCDADGNNPLPLTSFRGPLTGTPRWSPDGRQVVFDSRPGPYAHIFTVQVEGGAPRQLTSGDFNHVVPSWSRDGQWVYFASDRSGSWQVWKMPAAGGPPRQLTQSGGFAAHESYDGKFVYYAKGLDLPGIWRVPVEGGEEVPVMDDPPAGFWGYWALARDGIYYIRPAGRPRNGYLGKGLRPLIEFRSFAGGRRREIARPEKDPYYGAPGLTVAPDGSALLYVQVTHETSDIMLVENFR